MSYKLQLRSRVRLYVMFCLAQERPSLQQSVRIHGFETGTNVVTVVLHMKWFSLKDLIQG